MDYVSPEEASKLPGLRLALTCHVPAPYSMSAKAIFDLHEVPYVPVAQIGAGKNPELKAWTGHRNAPVAMYEDEPPRAGWLDILNLAQRLGKGPSLIPEDLSQRMFMFGLINELIGENGWLWHMRLIMLGFGGPERAAQAAKKNPMFADYGYSEDAHAEAKNKSKAIFDCFTAHARSQHSRGSKYLIGETLSALDVYWAYISQLVVTLDEERCPMPATMRKTYDMSGAAIGGCDPILVEQRDWIFANHLTLPMTF
jgi:glutathione S-transferase